MGAFLHRYYCWMDQVRGIGRITKLRLLRSAEERDLFSAELTDAPTGRAGAERIYRASEEELRFLCGEACTFQADAERTVQILKRAQRQEPEKIADDLRQKNISYICLAEERFPERLRRIPDPPFGLYCRGRLPDEDDLQHAAAVIGARMASGYGREQARRFGFRLAARGITIVSGMARGVDGIAQKAALDAGGRSFAVLGCGVDLCYPDENQALYDRLLEAGGILSEFPPGTPPDSKNFPQRNRIISGLADLVLVIEARKRSGTQITVDMALEQGREVFALPGRVSDALSDGCNRLIRQGAWIATCPEDVLEYFYGTGYGEGDEIIKKTGQGEKKPAGMAGDMAVKRGSMTASMEAAAGDPYHAQKNELEKNDSGIDDLMEPEETVRQPLTLADRILTLLSYEDGKHIEQILTELGEMEEQESGTETAAGKEIETGVGLAELNLCLFHMKMDGQVDETMAGYYRRTGA